MLPRQEGDAPIPDAHFIVGLKMRLNADVCPEGARCKHKKQDGSLCNALLDRKGWHARECECGKSRTYRHNSLRDWHAPFHTAQTGYTADREQFASQWDRVNPRTGEVELARLDVATRDAATAQPIYVDWSVTCEHTTYQPRRRARANKDGLAAAEAVDKKRSSYPPEGGEMIPAVLESGGRPADELVALVRSYGQDLDAGGRATVIATAWRQMHRTLVVGNAEMVLSAV